MPFKIIYTRTDKWLISKDEADWKAWNDKLYWFMACSDHESAEDLAEFLKDDFKLSDQSEQYIINCLSDGHHTYEINITDNNIIIRPLQLDLLRSKGEIIDWADWSYVFSKISDTYTLWVYVGGIADLCREIRLSDEQVATWEQKGNLFIKELAGDLQSLGSKMYLEATADKRKLL